MRGLLITLEGIDGCGKSTVAGMLREELPSLLPRRKFVFTAEPTTGDFGRLLRQRLAGRPETRASLHKELELLFLFLADHAEHLRQTVNPALIEGAVVISDRYSDSRVAYQGAALEGFLPSPAKWIAELHRPWSIPPDLTLLFFISPSLALERCRSRSQGLTEPERFERQEFLSRVSSIFQQQAQQEPSRFVVIDADDDLQGVVMQARSAILGFIEDHG